MLRRLATPILILACFCIGTMGAAHGQILHLISVADSNDPTIGPGTAANSKALTDYASLVALISKLTLNSKDIRGDDFRCTEIAKTIDDLQAKPDDVIIFYYSGHGFAPEHEPNNPAMPAQSKFPWFFCNPAASRPNLEAISRELGKKGARLTITVADTCNVIIPVPEEPLKAKGVIEQSIRTLFSNYKGNILITSSKRGQYSWYYPTGGLFTGKFLGLLRNPPDVEPRRLWQAIFARLQERIMVSAPSGPVIQEPEAPVATDLVFVEGR